MKLDERNQPTIYFCSIFYLYNKNTLVFKVIKSAEVIKISTDCLLMELAGFSQVS